MAFVAGKNLVPSPATGKTALRIRFWGAGIKGLQVRNGALADFAGGLDWHLIAAQK